MSKDTRDIFKGEILRDYIHVLDDLPKEHDLNLRMRQENRCLM